MERRVARVSEAQWNILLEFLERNPNLASGYNNSSRGRAESSRLWQEVTRVLNAERCGTTKTPKDWSIYVSNYKSKLRRVVAEINAEANPTDDGGPPEGSSLSDQDHRLLAIMRPGPGQTAPRDIQQPSTPANPAMPQTPHVATVENVHVEQPTVEAAASPTPAGAASPLRRGIRRRRYRSRPMTPLAEALRILMQQAATDAPYARALRNIVEKLGLIGQQLGRIADAVERYLRHISPQ